MTTVWLHFFKVIVIFFRHLSETEHNDTDWSRICSSVAAKIFEVIFDVKAETQKDIVPQEHLHSTKVTSSM